MFSPPRWRCDSGDSEIAESAEATVSPPMLGGDLGKTDSAWRGSGKVELSKSFCGHLYTDGCRGHFQPWSFYFWVAAKRRKKREDKRKEGMGEALGGRELWRPVDGKPKEQCGKGRRDH